MIGELAARALDDADGRVRVERPADLQPPVGVLERDARLDDLRAGLGRVGRALGGPELREGRIDGVRGLDVRDGQCDEHTEHRGKNGPHAVSLPSRVDSWPRPIVRLPVQSDDVVARRYSLRAVRAGAPAAPQDSLRCHAAIASQCRRARRRAGRFGSAEAPSDPDGDRAARHVRAAPPGPVQSQHARLSASSSNRSACRNMTDGVAEIAM